MAPNREVDGRYYHPGCVPAGKSVMDPNDPRAPGHEEQRKYTRRAWEKAGPYLQHARDWTITRDAIVRLAARMGRAFTYGELSAEIQEHDGLQIDGRGYAGALEAVAQNEQRNEPLWTSMVINQDTGQPGEGLWKANPDDRRYADAGRLSPQNRDEWLKRQRAWCIARARVIADPLDQSLRDAEIEARDIADTALVDLLLREHRGP
jgi:hypothetical protein